MSESFKEFFRELSEADPEAVLQEILDIMDTMSEEDVDEFGSVLYQEFFEDDPSTDMDDAPEFFEVDDVDEMIKELGPEVYEDILDLLEEIEDDSEDPEDEEGVEEAVSRRLKTKSRNRKKRKYMKKSKADLRRTAAARKKKNRANRQDRKKYYRKNKKKIAAYQKSRRDAIKKGKHKPKSRRNT